ncbi:MAG: hypothetical protein C0183_12550 [Roseiflexus castenholzii]|uniref:hypothetical protein n=1 Tax=Roseiflexus castenholzii TaxID=120962 RepID=UPI000CBE324A|nr:MAG: hypothetical protein C0183_12550 [Roseiflexus castenholzii]
MQSLGWLARAGGLLRLGCFDEAAQAAEKSVMLAHACPDQPLIGEGLALLMQIRAAPGFTAASDAELIEAQTIARRYFAPLAIPLGMPDAERLRRYCLDALCSSESHAVPDTHQPAVVAAPRKRRKTS